LPTLNGPEEIVDEPAVRGRYVLGVLTPPGQLAAAPDSSATA